MKARLYVGTRLVGETRLHDDLSEDQTRPVGLADELTVVLVPEDDDHHHEWRRAMVLRGRLGTH